MDEMVTYWSDDYFAFLALLLFARAMDFLSTWVATPNMVLEGNPIAKWLGWKWGALVNLALCGAFASAPLAAVIISTTSVLVAVRNFQSAWLMRTMGEQAYRMWMSERLADGRLSLFVLCLFAQCLLIAGVGTALLCLSGPVLVPIGVGIGMIGYALAVLIYSLISVRRWRRNHGMSWRSKF